MNEFTNQASAFVAGELLPTLAALAAAAASEPLSWAVLAAGVAGRVAWRCLDQLD